MAIGHWYDETKPIQQAGNWTIMHLGAATVENYDRTRKELERARGLTKDKARREVLGEMIADCEYAIEWLRTGRRPGARRGIEQPYSTTTTNVSKVCSWDPAWIEVYRSPNNWSGYQSRELTGDEQWRLQDAMQDLTDRERQCYTLHHGFGMSERDIAQELHLARSSVRTFLERAQAKIEYAKANSLFLI